jgi:regulator of sirC expression with transglutaminase-like and TPR domain
MRCELGLLHTEDLVEWEVRRVDVDDAWRGIGLVYERLGDKPAARSAFLKYLQLAPGAADAPEIRGRLGSP